MRVLPMLVAAVSLFAALAGCAGSDDPGADDVVLTPTPSATATSTPAPTTSAPTSPPPTTAPNSTAPPSEEPTATPTEDPEDPGPEGPTYGVTFHEVFEGSAPAPEAGPDALGPSHAFDLPAAGDHLVVWYNTTYTGLWSSVVTLADPTGTERASTLEACAVPDPGPMMAFSCMLEVQEEVASGTWTLTVNWQLGEVTEDYVLDVTAFGPLDA